MDQLRASDKNKITGLILAGGRGSRMGNLDKGLQQLDGMALVERVIQRIKPQVSDLAINANRHLKEYARFGLPVWTDPEANAESPDESEFRGPLAGVETGLRHCKTPYMLVVPCDSPFLPADLALRLFSALQLADIAVACTGNAESPRLQPVFCLIKISMLQQLQAYLDSGGRRMDGWYSDANVAKVHFSDEAAFSNINTFEELRSYSFAKPAK
ncbi:molybdopterin-guanine dinucleotide biosynthesis protein A [Oxalobacteraceae bacterium GrIS 2.11]